MRFGANMPPRWRHVGKLAGIGARGAGFVLVRSSETVEGYDGATGQRRWVFTLPKLGRLRALGMNGFGPDNVAVLRAWYGSATRSWALTHNRRAVVGHARAHTARLSGEFSGLPATVTASRFRRSTGARLGSGADDPVDVTWTALAPRTGVTMWSTTVAGGCREHSAVRPDLTRRKHLLTLTCCGSR